MLSKALQYARSMLSPACLSVCIGKHSKVSLQSAAAATEYKMQAVCSTHDKQATELIKSAYMPALVWENNRLVQ